MLLSTSTGGGDALPSAIESNLKCNDVAANSATKHPVHKQGIFLQAPSSLLTHKLDPEFTWRNIRNECYKIESSNIVQCSWNAHVCTYINRVSSIHLSHTPTRQDISSAPSGIHKPRAAKRCS